MPDLVEPYRGRNLWKWVLAAGATIGIGATLQHTVIALHDRINSAMSDNELVAVLAALGHSVRLSLWRMLLPYGSRGLPAGAIAEHMAIIPSSLSFHLRQMTQAGILVQRRSSRNIIYAVNIDVMDGMMALIAPAIVPPGDLSRQARNVVGN
jgi:ArsR family transcriptional regulator, arsenate/arsenite/antimonite-responsive transcriptional repressor